MSTPLEVIELDSIMRQESGRRFLTRLLRRTGYFDSTFSTDPRISDYKAAQREVGVWLYNEMKKANQGQLNEILREVNDDRSSGRES